MIEVNTPNVTFGKEEILSKFAYESVHVDKNKNDGAIKVTPFEKKIEFKTKRFPSKTGVMLVGWGGNNGTTVTGGILANKKNISWMTKSGEKKPDYFGSITQSSTIRLGFTDNLEEIFVPLNSLIPMVNPNDIVIGGWDCSGISLGDAMRRAQVYDVNLQDKLYPLMKDIKPLPAIFDLNFVAFNQEDRADNVISGTKIHAIEVVRGHIRDFKKTNSLDNVIVLWTANTERWCDVTAGIHDTADNLLNALKSDIAKEISPSSCYAVAAILEGCSYINGAPQNTLVPGVIELAKRHNVFVAGDDLKSGQTKIKSALIEFFVGAGIKPECIASYNHLGNNDGKNLASPLQFRSKEITKSNVVDDMIASNKVLYPEGSKKPDHCIVIKYLPFVGDSKRAMDEYIFSIFMGGSQTIVLHNTCEDSLLAAPLIIDLIILMELIQRVQMREDGKEFIHLGTVASLLSYLLKAPMVPAGAPVINALNRQKQAIENFLRALIGLPPDNNLLFETRTL